MRFQDMPYSRIDFEKEEENLKKIAEEFRQAGTWEEELEAHKKYYFLSDHVKTMRVLAEIRHSIDTADAFYSAEKDYYDEKMPEFSNREADSLGGRDAEPLYDDASSYQSRPGDAHPGGREGKRVL